MYPDKWREAARAALDKSRPVFTFRKSRYVFAPHGPFAASGDLQAWAFNRLDWGGCERVLLLGPIHARHRGIWLSAARAWETPCGPLRVDAEAMRALATVKLHPAADEPRPLSLASDEAEHALEMQAIWLPILGCELPIVPVYVGRADTALLRARLAPFLGTSAIVVTSDLCHWGDRFDYLPTTPGMSAEQTVQALDKRLLDALQRNDARALRAFFVETLMNACGRFAIEFWCELAQGLGVALEWGCYVRPP